MPAYLEPDEWDDDHSDLDALGYASDSVESDTDGTDLDDLCLDIDTDTVGLSTTGGTHVRGGVTEYETMDVAALEEDGEDEE